MDLIRNISAADPGVCERADSFLQSALWGAFKARFGWAAHAFLIDWAGVGERPLLVLCRRLAPALAMAYVPWGPELPEGFPVTKRNRALAELAQALRQLLPRNIAFIRFDPPWFAGEAPSGDTPVGETPAPLPRPFRRAAADIQPPDTALIDLTPPEQDILAAMKSKWRYNIGLAEKRGVTVTCSDADDLAVFYRLLTETAARDGIAVHGIEYYQTLFEVCREYAAREAAGIRLYTAVHEGDTLAAVVVLCRGKTATYLYGASSSNKRNLMAPYALQWKAMRDAKESLCAVYDLFGIPPNDDPGHPMAGLYRFKTGFGGEIIHRPGSWDYPCKPLLYGPFNAAEGLRKRLRDARKGK